MNLPWSLEDAIRHIKLEQLPRQCEEAYGSDGHQRRKMFDQNANPSVVLTILKTTKGLAEDQVTHDIRGCPCVPLMHVEVLLARVNSLVNTAYEEVYVALEHAFLSLESFV